MAFTTLSFCLFLGFIFVAYWSLGRRGPQNLLLVAASYVFYGWWDVRFCLLMLASSLVDYGVGWGLSRASSQVVRKALLWLSVASNLGLLGFFKYFNFFAENLHAACAALGWELDQVTLNVVLPVGISFYTFQTMSYTLDVYRGRLQATTRLVDYLAFVSFFPQLVAGPIERATRLLPQFMAPRVFDEAKAGDGCRLILWGFFKKLVIADRLSPFVNEVYGSLSTAGGAEVALATAAFAFQIYCDFSAYSDIAIGTAKLFGFDLMRNFAYPYFSQSVGEFWRRWHISLSTWFRDYVYIPLGGNRHGRLRLLGSLFVTFVLSGIWHGASWNFVIWGGVMALGIAPEALWGTSAKSGPGEDQGLDALVPSPRALLRMMITFAIICFGWIFFRAETLADAMTAIGRMAADVLSPRVFTAANWGFLVERSARNALVAMTFIVTIEWIRRSHPHPLVMESVPRWTRWSVYTALVWITLLMGPRAETQFIYFQF